MNIGRIRGEHLPRIGSDSTISRLVRAPSLMNFGVDVRNRMGRLQNDCPVTLLVNEMTVFQSYLLEPLDSLGHRSDGIAANQSDHQAHFTLRVLLGVQTYYIIDCDHT